MNITDPIRGRAHERPDAPAVVRPDGPDVTFRALDRSIDALAHRLSGLGLGPGKTVGVGSLPLHAYLVLRLALSRLGATSGTVANASVPTDLYFVAGAAPALAMAVMRFDPAWAEPPPESADVQPLPSHPDAAAICSIFPSSGTTGIAKHVAVSHELMQRRLDAKGKAVPLPAGVRQICTVGIGSQYGFASTLRVLWAGGTVVLERPDTPPDALVASILRNRVNALLTAPMTLERLMAAMPPREGPLPTLELVEVGGSLLPARLVDVAERQFGRNVVSSYGSAEAASVATAPVRALAGIPGAVGYVHSGVEVQAVDEHDQPLPPGREGVLRIRSDLCASAYVGSPELSARVFRNGWVYPGDVGVVGRDGMLAITGREGELINSGGVKVSPQVVEDVLLSVPEIAEAAAFGVDDAMGVTRIWAAMVTRGPVDAAALHALCVRRLGPKAPRFVMRMDALPRNENGKVRRGELAKFALERYPEKARGV